jgi:hypothetical protein
MSTQRPVAARRTGTGPCALAAAKSATINVHAEIAENARRIELRRSQIYRMQPVALADASGKFTLNRKRLSNTLTRSVSEGDRAVNRERPAGTIHGIASVKS